MADWDHTGTGNAAHNAAVTAANNTRAQAYKAAGGSAAAVRAADLAWARSVVASAKQNNLTTPQPAVEMIWELTGGYS